MEARRVWRENLSADPEGGFLVDGGLSETSRVMLNKEETQAV